jgi:hypothetical protein
MRQAGRLGLRIAVAALVLFFLGRYITRYWNELRHAGDAIEIHGGYLVAAAVVILATYAMLIVAWDAVLRGWGERLAYPAAARIWCLSNLAKYVPGKVWQIAGMAALAQQAGVSPWAAAGSAIVVQLLNIATGTLVTFAFAPRFGSPWLVGLAGLATAAGAAALAWPAGAAWLSRTIHRVTGREFELRAVGAGPLILSAAITALAWIFYGVALYFSVRGLTGRDVPIGTAVGVFTGSYVAGLINPFLPAGLGTREVILVNWLTGPLGPAAAAVVAAGSRILMTATEIMAALVTLPLLTPRVDVRQA